METLLGTFLATGLAEFGDKTQLLVLLLVARHGPQGTIAAGIAAGALANAAIAATAGAFVHDMAMLRAVSLLLALALLFAGIVGLGRPRVPGLPAWPLPAGLAAAVSFFLIELGDRTQFLTLAITARYDAPVLAAAGATAGVMAANAPAFMLGKQAERLMPLRQIRLGSSLCFLLLGSAVAINALRLI